MPIQYRDETPPGEGDNDPIEALKRLLSNNGEVEIPEEALETLNKLSDLAGPEIIQVVLDANNAMDAMVQAAHEFLAAEDKGGDTTQAMLAYASLVKKVVETLPPMALGSIISAGCAAVAELERLEKKNEN